MGSELGSRSPSTHEEHGVCNGAPTVVTGYLDDEPSQNRIAQVGSCEKARELGIQYSSFAVIPKKNRANKWWLILDQSVPEGRSVNDGIQTELASLTCVSVDDVVAEVVKRGRGTLIAKMDVKRAYRNIPVHPQDRHLLGMHWKGEIFVDMVLPFGLRSAPLLFTAVADALQWVMEHKGVTDMATPLH